jgi:hypothetical protein
VVSVRYDVHDMLMLAMAWLSIRIGGSCLVELALRDNTVLPMGDPPGWTFGLLDHWSSPGGPNQWTSKTWVVQAVDGRGPSPPNRTNRGGPLVLIFTD